MRKKIRLAALFSGLSLLALAQQNLPQPAHQPIAFTHVNVVNIKKGRVLLNQTVLIEGEKIASVKSSAAPVLPRGVQEINAPGKYLIPGLIETHAHLFMPWHRNWPDTTTQLEWILAGGVTTVRDAAATGLELNYMEIQKKISAGTLPGPRIIVSWFAPGVMALTQTKDLDSAFAQAKSYGIEAIKIRGEQREQAFRIIQAARKNDLPVYGHTTRFLSDTSFDNYTMAAIQQGISGLSHIAGRARPQNVTIDHYPQPAYNSPPDVMLRADVHFFSYWAYPDRRMLKSLIDSMIAHGTWLEPTLVVTFHDHEALYRQCSSGYDTAAIQKYYTFYKGLAKATLNGAERDTIERACQHLRQFISDFYKAGGKIITGTDYPPFPPLGVTEEMRLLVEAGLPPAAALQAATINAAEALGKEAEIGTVEAGKRADLVLLEGNPLADVANCKRIRLVVASGRLYEPAQLWKHTGATPPTASYDDLPEKMEDRLKDLAYNKPDSVVRIKMTTNPYFQSVDVAEFTRSMRLQEVKVEEGFVMARTSAFGARLLSRLRFIDKLTLVE